MSAITLNEPTADVSAETRSTKPLQVFRHRNLSASVFVNQSTTGGTFRTVSLQRAYKDADDEYQHSSSFTRDEIPVARIYSRRRGTLSWTPKRNNRASR